MVIRTIDDLIHHYQLEIDKIERNLPERERWGHGPWDNHELSKNKEFVQALKCVAEESRSQKAWKGVQKAISKISESDEWHDSEDPPCDNRWIILRFGNSEPMVGRYEGNDEDGGNYYIGDDEVPAIRQHMFVEYWAEIPEYGGDI